MAEIFPGKSSASQWSLIARLRQLQLQKRSDNYRLFEQNREHRCAILVKAGTVFGYASPIKQLGNASFQNPHTRSRADHICAGDSDRRKREA